MKPYSEKFIRKRKFFCVLPVLIFPFVTLAFWGLGGGTEKKGTQPVANRFNSELPEAVPAAIPFDKMSLYNQVEKDSESIQQQMFGEPSLFNNQADLFNYENKLIGHPDSLSAVESQESESAIDPYEEQINKRITRLKQAMNEKDTEFEPGSNRNLLIETEDAGIEAEPANQDPELQQMDEMLDKLLDLQNPERMRDKVRAGSLKSKGNLFPVLRYKEFKKIDCLKCDTANRSGIDSMSRQYSSPFFDIGGLTNVNDTMPLTAISAVMHESKTLVNGETVKLRLTTEAFVNGRLIPKGTLVSGSAEINGGRLKVEINAIRIGENILPVTLTVYDLDAIEGISIPNAITREAAKEGSDRVVQGVQLMSLNESVAGQAANAGLEAAKGLIGRKSRLIRVTVKAGHPILLLNKNLPIEN